MAIETNLDVIIPVFKIVASFTILIGFNHLFQAVKEILISKYAIGAHKEMTHKVFDTIKDFGQLKRPSRNEKILYALIENLNLERGVDDIEMEDIAIRLLSLEKWRNETERGFNK